MGEIVIVSNRLPVSIKHGEGDLIFEPSIGGLATGIKSFHIHSRGVWIGWNGIPEDELSSTEQQALSDRLFKQFRYISVPLSNAELHDYYYGFSNGAIWPLFHYVHTIALFDNRLFEAYREVNRKFMEAIASHIKPGDTLWLHDYQLLLLPNMLRERFPDIAIGFFLHIPFPSYELFRLLPWREEILEGILGADLIGFHTYDYVRHFLSSIRRLLRLDSDGNRFYVGDRTVQADVFPMGIDYERYATALSRQEIRRETTEIFERTKGMQVILSVDRLDYTKGIPQRIRAYALFLRDNPQYRERVAMILIVAPSRVHVGPYQELLKEIEELVSHTNGEFGAMGWSPIWFFYRSFQFESLTALYGRADVMLVTPLRDGMNLVAKEYIAASSDRQGVLVISEGAGAASELGEALLVNPTNIEQVATSLKQALEMPRVEQISRNSIMHERLQRYTVDVWARDFMDKLDAIHREQRGGAPAIISAETRSRIITEYTRAARRILFLDYDGTLTSFREHPADAVPDEALLELLHSLTEQGVEVVIISGRDRDNLQEWFGHSDLGLIALHGMWTKRPRGKWNAAPHLNDKWKEEMLPVLRLHTDRTPGSIIEEKSAALAWHYRRCDPDLAQLRLGELREVLRDMTQNKNVGLLEGNKVLELRDNAINKGVAAISYIHDQAPDFILSAGDDWTDEEMFTALPQSTCTIKVGIGVSAAAHRLASHREMRTFIAELATT